jgi:hypothetical protein
MMGDGQDQDEALREQARVLREGRHLGKSPTLISLFDYLLQTSLEGRRPKELEVAAEVFGRGEGFDAMQDASVRVYAYRLRRKLEEYYAGPGVEQKVRIALPRGEYRLAVQAPDEVENVVPEVNPPPPRLAWLRAPWFVAGATATLCMAVAVVAWFGWLRPDNADREVAAVRETAVWQPMLTPGKPIVVVVGDYYIFGETDPGGRVSRLVREFSINSRYDLDERAMQEPARAKQFRDLGLRYYPLGMAVALRDVMPILRTFGRKERPPRVIPASDLTPDMLRISNIVYIGYFSGLRALRDPLFTASRFRVGSSYDELFDRRTGKIYAATSSGDNGTDGARQDLGYVGSFPGPNGNRILVIAGTRDAGVMQAADYVTHLAGARSLGGGFDVEALLQVDTIGDQNLAGKLLFASPLNPAGMWRGGSPQGFPDDPRAAIPEGW